MCGEKTYYTYQVKEQETEKYDYRCARCYCTLYADPLEEDEEYTTIMTDELCPDCEREQEMENLFYIFEEDDWDD